MNGKQSQSPEALVTGPTRIPGVVQVRQSVVLLGSCAIVLVVGLMLWLIVTKAGAIAAPEPERLAARSDTSDLRPSNPLTLQQNGTTSAALPTAHPTDPPRSEPTLDPSLLAAAPDPASANTAPQAPQPMSQETESPRERMLRERAQARSHALAVAQAARESELRVRLDGPSDMPTSVSDSAPARTSGARYAAVNSDNPDAYDIPPASDYVLQRGMIVPATLYTSIDSTLQGTITALVNADVYDSRHRAVLVPRGAKLTGTYQSNVAQGQARLFVAWDAIKLPNDHTIPLGSMPGVDLSGSAGFGAAVDHHTAQLFRSVVLLSVLSAGAQLSQPQNVGTCGLYGCQASAGQQAAASVGQGLTQAGTQILARDANVMPTLHVSEGSQVAVMVEADIPLHPWSTDP